MKMSLAKEANNSKEKPLPPGRIKIVRSLKSLLVEKEFSAITTAEIAKTAGVTEPLIYKYFRDKRDLLHQVLSEYAPLDQLVLNKVPENGDPHRDILWITRAGATLGLAAGLLGVIFTETFGASIAA